MERQLVVPRLNSLDLNAVVVRALRDLDAREALPTIKNGFFEQQENLSEGTWDEVNDALGS